MKKLILIILFSSSISLAFSQKNTNSLNTGSTEIFKNGRIDVLNETYKTSYTLKGYRIQIYSGNKKQPANQARASFLRSHKKTKAHLSYEQPQYKVKIGDFKTKLEALKYKNKLAKEFPNCFIVKDEIDIEELID